MNQEEFKILMTSDVGKAIPDLQSVGKAMSNLAGSADEAAAALGITGAAAEKTSTSAKKLASATPELGKTFVNAGGALTSFNRIVQDAPFGFIAIGNNITDFVEKLGALRQQTGSTGGVFKALAGSLLGAGGISLAISAITSGITGLIQKYGDLGTALLAITGNLSSAQQAQLDYNDAVAKGVGKAEGEIAKVNAFISVAKDESIARDQRLKAIKELQKEYPGYLDNLTLENVNSDQTAQAIDRLSSSLIRKAKIQAAQDRISEEFGKILDAQSKSVVLQASTWDLFTAALTSAGHTQSVITAAINSGIKNQGKTVSQAEANIASFQNLLNSLLKEDAIDGVLGLGKGGGEKNIKTVADILKELNLELTAVDAKAQAFGATAKDLGTDKINALKKAMEELLKIGIQPGSVIFANLQKIGEEIQKFITEKPLNLGPQKIPVPIEIEALPTTQTTKLKGLTDTFSKVFNDENGRLQYSIADIQNTLAGGVSSIADSIGQVLSPGGGIQNVLVGFSGLISNLLNKVGDDMIKLGVTMIAIKKGITLSFSNPAFAIAAGVAAKVAASLLKSATQSSIGGSVPAFANGGITNGLTLGILGDNPGGREAIIPSQDWREAFNMFSAPARGFIAETMIAGADLKILLRQADLEGGRY